MRVCVTGGRAYSDAHKIAAVLNKLHREVGIDILIEGGAHGADRLARQWAMSNRVQIWTFEADWEGHGNFAGPMRNKEMIAEGRPDVVVAFPTPGEKNKGTRGMMTLA